MARHVLLALALAAALPSAAAPLQNRDALAESPVHPRRAFSAAPYLGTLLDPAHESRVDDRLGLPTFLWAARQGPAAEQRSQAAARLSHEQAARLHLNGYAELWQVSGAAARAATLRELHDTGTGALIARFEQSQGGVPVFRSGLNVVMDRGHALLAVTGFLSPDVDPSAPAPYFPLGAHDAAARALADLHGGAPSASEWGAPRPADGGYQRLSPSPAMEQRLGLRFSRAPRTRPVLFQLQDRLEPAHYLELFVESASGAPRHERFAFAYVVSAVDGRLLLRSDLTRDAAPPSYTYRVWIDPATLLPAPDPQGRGALPYRHAGPDETEPAYVAPALVTLSSYPYSKNDPWLPANASSTAGNNVDAYADLAAPDGFSSGDVRPDVTAAGTFDRIYDTSKAPGSSSDQQKASATNLFVLTNFFHDWYYDVGFDEKSGNAQVSNLGRGGVEHDPVQARAQDFNGTDNSAMATPADGESPEMFMFVFTLLALDLVTVTAPAAAAGSLQHGPAQFGAQTYDLTGTLVAAAPPDACTPLTNAAALSGKIAFIDRGTCPFVDKVKAAQAAGALAVVVGNNDVGLLTMAGADAAITIPSVIILQDDAARLHAQTVPVTVHLNKGGPRTSRDGALDGGIVAHEWGHYIQNRLIGNGTGLLGNQSGGLGEGFSDFHAMLFQVRKEDAAVVGNDQWQGSYSVGAYASQAFTSQAAYYGIRRYPYSTDLAKNPLTFKHIQEGTRLPGAGVAPIAPGFPVDGSFNSEVHNTGEVWAAMLWECYAALLRDSTGGTPRLTFQQAQDRMKAYLVASYKAMPLSPTLLEARDALLVAAAAGDLADYTLFLKAFAKRGAGIKATGPDRYSFDNVGVLESGDFGPAVRFESFTLDDSVTALCGADGVLQAGETGKLTVKVRNVGSAALANVTGAVTSSLLTFPTGATLSFGALAPEAVGTASINVALPAGTTGVQKASFQLVLSDAALTAPVQVALAREVNFDSLPYQSATDDVEAIVSTWTLSHSTDTDEGSFAFNKWRRVEVAADDHRWFAPTPPQVTADLALVSPPLAIGSAQVTLSFTHRYNLSVAQTLGGPVNADGGVVEYSKDGGTTWQDLSVMPYPGVVATASFLPLSGRKAFVAKSKNWPDQVETVSVKLPATFASSGILLRFRVSAYGIGGWGWEIDNLKLDGITNLPFAANVARGATCSGVPVAKATAPATGQEAISVQLDGSGSTNAPGATGALSYRWYQVSGPAAVLSSATDVKPTYLVKGLRKSAAVVFGLSVASGGISSAPATASTVITHVPLAPVADAGKAQSVAPLAMVTLDGSKSADAYEFPLTYTWTQTGGPTVKLTTSSDNAIAQFAAGEESAALTFSLVVNNGETASPAATVVVNVVKSGCGCSSGGGGFSLPLLPVAFLLAGLRRRRKSG